MLAAGLFGKLPAHGDFVARGWPDALLARLDKWLADGLAAVRQRVGERGYADCLHAAPLWHLWLRLDDETAVHGVITPTCDSAGRLFMLVAGAAGPLPDSWALASQQPGFAATAEAAAYRALAGELDADGLAATLADALPAPTGVGRFLAGLSLPVAGACWVPDPAAGPPLALPAAAADAATLARLLEGA
jgi:type VI secretion system protein ImpM